MLQLTDNASNSFRDMVMLDMKNDIKRRIKFTLSKEVVISRVKEVKLGKIVFLNKMVEDMHSECILWIYICISPNEDNGVIIGTENVTQTGVKEDSALTIDS